MVDRQHRRARAVERQLTSVCTRSLDSEIQADDDSALVRRVSGPEAEELAFHFRPICDSADVGAQARALYTDMLERLAAEGASVGQIASETIFVADIAQNLETVLEARRQVLERCAAQPISPATSFIEQAPLNQHGRVSLCVLVIVPRRPQPAYDVSVAGAANGDEPSARLVARLVPVGDQTQLHAGNIYGSGENAFEEAYSMFCSAERLLHEAGMSFGEVIRTWIYLRDMDRDYDEFNRARSEFFGSRGIELKPASTAVGGGPHPAGHDFTLRLYALKSSRPLAVEVMSAPTLNEAWSYGSDFSRGLKVKESNKVALYVSGTASIDEAGRTVHVGDFEAQARRMLVNIAALLGAQGASFEDLVSAIVYVKHSSDAPLLRALFHDHGFEGFPCAFVEAAICRPELLCETEAVAALPLPKAKGVGG